MTDATGLEGSLFYGDNLDVLRNEFPDHSVDLVYLDPPFNSNASYNVLFRDESGNTAPSQIRAFEDTWHWGPDAVDALLDLNGTPTGNLLNALTDSIGENQLTAYLCMMGVRLVELRRVLKPSGNIFLHCDTTAGHYLKLVMDAAFHGDNFRNQIIWRRTAAKGLATRRLPRNHDMIFAYAGSPDAVWNMDEVFVPYDPKNIDPATLEHYRHEDADGRRYALDNLVNPTKSGPTSPMSSWASRASGAGRASGCNRNTTRAALSRPAPARCPATCAISTSSAECRWAMSGWTFPRSARGI